MRDAMSPTRDGETRRTNTNAGKVLLAKDPSLPHQLSQPMSRRYNRFNLEAAESTQEVTRGCCAGSRTPMKLVGGSRWWSCVGWQKNRDTLFPAGNRIRKAE